jgi:hypothetical protein
LLDISGPDVELSNVRRRDGVLEVRLWNPRADRSARITVADRETTVGPAEIATIT